MLWGRIYSLGVRIGRQNLFYFFAAAAGLVQLGLLGLLRRSPDPRATQAKPTAEPGLAQQPEPEPEPEPEPDVVAG